MKRWAAHISDSDGLDAVIQLADDPEKVKERVGALKNITKKQKENRATIIHIFEEGSVPSGWNLEKALKKYENQLQRNIEQEVGGSTMDEYTIFDLRGRYMGGNVLTVSVLMTEKEMSDVRHTNPYEGALRILERIKQGKGNVMRGGNMSDVEDYIDIMKVRAKKSQRK